MSASSQKARREPPTRNSAHPRGGLSGLSSQEAQEMAKDDHAEPEGKVRRDVRAGRVQREAFLRFESESEARFWR